jgi:phosphoribosyl 1,2-cyclic phosphodiesterase
MKAVIWGSCGSVPSPLSSSAIRSKLVSALWDTRNQTFQTKTEIENYLDQLPHSASGTYKANTSCVQIVAQTEEVILCDAGTGIRDYALSIKPDAAPRSYHIFISHLHWDHIQGFPFFTPAYQAGNRITFHGFHPEIESIIRQQMEAPCFPVPFSTMQADIDFDIREEGSSFEVDGVQIRTIKQQHPGDAWGYSFEEAGQRIVYSSDSEHGPEAREDGYPFVNFFKSADVLIFDGQYTFEEATNEKRNWGHSDHRTAVELASRAEVKKLTLFHHEPSYSDAMIEEILQDALKHRETFNRASFPKRKTPFPSELVLAYDGMSIET